jgi:hypothetical protein
MQRPTPTTRTLGAAAITLVLASVVAVFTAIGYAGPTAAAQQYAPQNTTPPSITGEAREGSTLTANPGVWTSSSAIAYAYQFRRCDSNGANCANITGANRQTYQATSADVGRRLKVVVTASNTTGSSASESSATAVIAARDTSSGAIQAAAVVLPNRLVVDTVRYSRSPLRSREAFTASIRVTDTRGTAVQGALVYTAGIPFSRIEQPTEVQTDSRGIATITIQPTRLLPLRDGFLLTMFVRARNAGDDLLAGVSSRRLVSLRTASPR